MQLEKKDVEFAAQVFIDYYKNFDRIDDYLRKVKLERVAEMFSIIRHGIQKTICFVTSLCHLKTWSLNVESYQMNSMTTI